MAPEQALDEPLGPYTDLYALGIIAYELLAGRPPFEPGRTPMAVLYCHVHRSPPPLAELAPDVPEAVCGWVEWMLAKKPEDRPASADEAAQALEEIAVAELGPYWRRSAAIAPPADGGEDRTTEVSPPARRTAVAPETPPRPSPRRRRRRLAVGAVAVLVIATGALVGWAADSDRRLRPGRRSQAGARSYDFDGDDRQELAIGLPTSGPSGAGIVLTHGGRGAAAASDAEVTARAAGLAHLDGREGFGTSVASADFDRDGRADLAVSAPGRDLVLVIHGTARGLRPDRVERIRPSEMRTLEGPGRYGSRLLAADLDRDGYGDLVVGAPDADPGDRIGRDPGRCSEVPGTCRPIGRRRSRGRSRCGRASASSCGRGTSTGTETSTSSRVPPTRSDGTPGHLSYCLGTRTGRMKPCVSVGDPATAGTSALAVADVNGDDYGDIVQGDALGQAEQPRRPAAGPGVARRARGPNGEPISHRAGPGRRARVRRAGDAFGAAWTAGDLDGDGYADIVIAAPGDSGGEGAVSVIRGGRSGVALAGHTRFAKGDGVPGDPVAGEGFGGSLAGLELTGDGRLDVAVTVAYPERPADGVFLMAGRAGAFSPGETRVTRLLRGARGAGVPWGRHVRVGRPDGVQPTL